MTDAALRELDRLARAGDDRAAARALIARSRTWPPIPMGCRECRGHGGEDANASDGPPAFLPCDHCGGSGDGNASERMYLLAFAGHHPARIALGAEERCEVFNHKCDGHEWGASCPWSVELFDEGIAHEVDWLNTVWYGWGPAPAVAAVHRAAVAASASRVVATDVTLGERRRLLEAMHATHAWTRRPSREAERRCREAAAEFGSDRPGWLVWLGLGVYHWRDDDGRTMVLRAYRAAQRAVPGWARHCARAAVVDWALGPVAEGQRESRRKL